ncbi:N-acetylmuramoyl-L-alanine amidase [Cellulomonas hominis]|uniref:N-acetylmuramoyl-L-alanine amidase n=1 Tax=Cellulomonas hominis TaxID=156981 RepID=UPI001443E6BA|nr:N-acetylmuramoyl-L-alanine amidase [Cellulomonas hominis]NKY09929.1 hypothetical protein [Cellulomonas hominis]
MVTRLIVAAVLLGTGGLSPSVPSDLAADAVRAPAAATAPVTSQVPEPGADAPAVDVHAVPLDVAADPGPALPDPADRARAEGSSAESVVPGVPVPADQPIGSGRVATAALELGDVETVGVTWPATVDGAGLDVRVRTRSGETWSGWTALDDEAAPDAGTVDDARAVRGGTEPLWLGDADAFQVSVALDAGMAVPDLSLALIGPAGEADSGDEVAAPDEQAGDPAPPVPTATPEPSAQPSSAADPAVADTAAGGGTADGRVAVVPAVASSGWRAQTATHRAAGDLATLDVAAGARTPAATSAGAPRVISRSEWGAPAQVCAPDVARDLVGAVVHHTAGSSTYGSVAEAMAQLRNDAAYHINTRGWCDIGYNFVVDKWGNIYEGRAGSMTAPVIGVHAGGFNTGTVGVAMLGTYDSAPSTATRAAVGTIIGWRLGSYRIDPRSTMRYTTGSGENSRFSNETVTLPRVFGHRDVSYTACPGDGGYAALAAVRDVAWDAAQSSWSRPPSRLLRTEQDATVYLVSGTRRYAIGDLATLSALSPLGPVAFVPQQYLGSFADGGSMKRVVRAPDGTISFVDAGIRLSFSSCAQVADFGVDCGAAVQLDATQISQLHDGGRMAPLYRTTSGKAFYVTGGVKREVADDASLQAAGLPSTAVWLLETGIGYLPYGDPVVRSGLRVDQRDGSRSVLTTTTGSILVPGGLTRVPGLSSGTAVALDAPSVARLPVTTTLAPFVVDDASGTTYLLSERGKLAVGSPSTAPAAPVRVPGSVLAGVPAAGATSSPLILKGERDGTVYLVSGGTRYGIRGWGDLVRLTRSGSPSILVLADDIVRQIADGGLYDPPGMLARTPGDATVYLLDGTGKKVPVATFAVTDEIGATRLAVVPDAALSARADAGSVLRTFVQCGATTYAGLGGRLWPIRPEDRPEFPQAVTVLDPSTCDGLPQSERPVERFWRTPDGTIYLVSDGLKQPIGSIGRYVELGGTSATTIQVSPFAASQVPTGARL